ncbi:MAG: phage Gp37/Gp68 family protein [Acidobacteria bacterium]|nr:phage Gp37/Gp68 family protein [Acidobacteriota bacterium]
MSNNSKIEWTDTTWNPLRGCQKISPGCKHCYAETFAERFRGVPNHPYEFGFDLRLVPNKLAEPFLWTSPKTVFVNSMSDLFQDEVPTEYIVETVRVMAMANWHTYQVLTKRAERMKRLLNGELKFAASLPHIWWGVSVENKKYGFPRITHLNHTKAAIRFLSVEPLLEDLGKIDLRGVHWVIVGGESGPGFRLLEESWVRSILSQCEEAKIPFFFKQWGGYPKGKRGRLIDGQTYDGMPPRQTAPIPDRKTRLEFRDQLSPNHWKWNDTFPEIVI